MWRRLATGGGDRRHIINKHIAAHRQRKFITPLRLCAHDACSLVAGDMLRLVVLFLVWVAVAAGMAPKGRKRGAEDDLKCTPAHMQNRSQR